MYNRSKVVPIAHSTSMLAKNLQVVSFDADWREIYLGTAHKDTFSALCPNDDLVTPQAAKVEVNYTEKDNEPVTITSAKWCPLENSTVLVLGSQFGVKLFDWDGSTQIYDYNFHDNGIGVDDRLVAGGMARGIAALGAQLICVGLHTGTLLVFEVTMDDGCFACRIVDSQRAHVNPIADLASTTLPKKEDDGKEKHLLVSGDETGLLNIWSLGHTVAEGLCHVRKVDALAQEAAITTLSIWNRIGQGIVLVGYGSGLLRIFSLSSGDIVAEVTAHVGWITGMDLASQSGLLVTAAEDGFIRVWQLSQTGRIIDHRFSQGVSNCLLTGVKFLDPKGASFACVAYYSAKIHVYRM